MYILVCVWVFFYVSHDYLIINRLEVCSLTILPPDISTCYTMVMVLHIIIMPRLTQKAIDVLRISIVVPVNANTLQP